MSLPDRPLVTLVLLTFNQEKWVDLALAGVAAQTWSPLQIILSDDCSDDDSWDRLRAWAKAYDGPHEVVLNRSSENLGIAGHLNAVHGLAKGDLIVLASGDDVSRAGRVEALVERWLEDPDRIQFLHSSARDVDMDGRSLPGSSAGSLDVHHSLADFVEGRAKVLGATEAWSRSLVDRFGPIRQGIRNEDKVFPFRALLMGQVAFVDQELVDYRRDAGVTAELLSAADWINAQQHPRSFWTTQVLLVEQQLQDALEFEIDPMLRHKLEVRGRWFRLFKDLSSGKWLPRGLFSPSLEMSIHHRLSQWLTYRAPRLKGAVSGMLARPNE